MNRQQRFIASKCDRCGKATSARQNGCHDLYVLSYEEFEWPLADQGNFCLKCVSNLDKQDWFSWFELNRKDWLDQWYAEEKPQVLQDFLAHKYHYDQEKAAWYIVETGEYITNPAFNQLLKDIAGELAMQQVLGVLAGIGIVKVK